MNILENISFSINKGEVVAVVGESGSGKSTMADLIPRFFDVDQGKIKIDGHDIRELEKKSLRSLMGIVPQETILFNDTIAKKIGYGKKAIKKKQLIKHPQDPNTINKIKGNMLKSQQKNLLFEYDLDNDNRSIWERRIKQNEDGTFIVVHESLYDEKGIYLSLIHI